MKIGSAALIVLFMGGCAAGPAVAAKDRPARRCDASQCFRQRDIRDYEVIDDDTLVVFTGARHCAFVVKLRGAQCRLDFATQIAFLRRRPGTVGPRSPLPGSSPDPFGIDRGAGRSYYESVSRVCAYSPRLLVYTGPVDAGSLEPLGGLSGLGDACDIGDVYSITDDELLEMYVDRHITPPPPPVGPGELRVTGQDESGDTDKPGEDAAPQERQEQGGAAQEPR